MWGDQALTLNAALEWVHGGALPLASMKSSFGVFNPPLVQYLYALPLFFSTNLLGVVGLVALVNFAGVLALGWAAARVLSRRTAAWAMVLLAVNPWAVYYGRLIWMQSFVPGFAALALAAVLLYFGDRPRWRYALARPGPGGHHPGASHGGGAAAGGGLGRVGLPPPGALAAPAGGGGRVRPHLAALPAV
jgi:hypothetical protein